MFWKKWFPRKEILQSPYGPLPTTVTEIGKADGQSTRPLTAAELNLKARCVEEALALAQDLDVGLRSAGSMDADELDELLRRWNPAVDTTEGFNQAAQVIGFAFGEHLARRYQMKWAVLSDEYGVDFAVTHETLECTSFPISVVAKRLESGDRGFLGPVAFAVQRQLHELGAQR
jgi:hypothetical protein